MARYGAAILTIAGTIVGAYFGYPALGAALGSLAGSLLFTPKGANTTGPRLADITQTTSSVGVNIPRGWGTFAVAGTFVAQSALREVMVSQTQGGKGVSGGSTQTTPTYFQDFAILINDSGPPEAPRPLVGVRTVWANGKAIYDRRPRNDTETDATYNQRLAASDQLEGQFTLYLGTEDQLPDPTLEATYGVGGISAFRGCAYIVFINWQNKPEDGNRIPATWLFECYTEGTSADETTTEYAQEILTPWGRDIDPRVSSGSYIYESMVGINISINGPWTTESDMSAAVAAGGGTADPNTASHGAGFFTGYAIGGDASNANINLIGGPDAYTPGWTEPASLNFHYNVQRFDVSGQFGADVYDEAQLCYAKGQKLYSDGGHASTLSLGLQVLMGGPPRISTPDNPIDAYRADGWDSGVINGALWNIDSLDRTAQVTRALQPPPDPCESTSAFPVPLADGSAPTNLQLATATPIPGLDGYTLVNGELRKCGPWAKTAGTWRVLQKYTDGPRDGLTVVMKYPLGPARPLGDPDYDSEQFWTDAYNAASAAHNMPAGLVYGTDYPVAQAYAYERTITQTTTTTFPANVAQVTGDLCLEAGYQTTDFDVTALEDMTVMGYVRTGIMAARDAIDPLRQVCFFDGIESDGVLKFVARGQPNTFDFALDDLGAMIASGDSSQPTTRISTVKQLETDLPRRVTVTYLSQARDYQTNNQASPVRVNTRAVNETAIQLPMVLDDSQALEIATALWAQAWVERWTHSIVVSGKRQELEPADCGTIPLDGENVRVRITDIQDSLPATRQLSLTRDKSVNYAITRTAGVPAYTPVPIRISTPALVFMLDLPPLQDQDNDAGFYFACMSQLAGNFTGAQLFRSQDQGGSYQLVSSVSNEATIGTVLIPALDTDSFDVLDGVSQLTVSIQAGSFDSCTLEALLADSNALAVGADGRWEIIQFMTAVQTSPKLWVLSGLLRGRRGTEQFIGTGKAGDLAVLVSGVGVARAAMQITGVGKSYAYRILATGQSVDQVSDQFFSGQGVALKPFSPALVRGVRDATSGDWTFSWLRRGRIGQTLQSGVDIALSEDTEDYEIDVMSGSAIVRTLSTSNEQVLYNAAAQVTDFGARQASLSIVVYQVSAQVGRGYGTSATLTA